MGMVFQQGKTFRENLFPSNPDISTDTAVAPLLFLVSWAFDWPSLSDMPGPVSKEELGWVCSSDFGDIHGNPYLGRFKVKMLVFDV